MSSTDMSKNSENSTLMSFDSDKQMVTELDNENGNKQVQEQMNDNDKHGNGRNNRPHLLQSVSIIVEPVLDDCDTFSSNFKAQTSLISPGGKQSPVLLLDDINFDAPRKPSVEDEIVKSIIANARLRKEEFARLLEEHAEIVHEINRVETSLL